MPIRAENRDRYPADWKAIRALILDRAGFCCEQCGVENHRMIYRGSHELRPAWRYADDPVFESSRCAFDGSEIPGTSWDDFDKRRGDPVKVVLTIAHLDHTPENCAPENLRAWCQSCHNAYDAPMRRAGIKARARAQLAARDLLDGRTWDQMPGGV
jgi:5-methylcytosine-specific restriction endonuclease McrA